MTQAAGLEQGGTQSTVLMQGKVAQGTVER